MEDNKQKNKYNSYFDNGKYNENNYYQNKQNQNSSHKNIEDKGFFRKIDKERKIALIVLSFFSLAIILLAFLNINDIINRPFVLKDPITGEKIKPGGTSAQLNKEKTCTGPNCFSSSDLVRENIDLKMLDTDGDGISDWDELFIHGTSPYLEDTSGDGISDYEAIFIYKIDPTCPAGEDCSSSIISTEGQFVNQGQTSNPDDIFMLLNNASPDTSSQADYFNLPVSEIRKQLAESGVETKDLDLMSDEDLILIYQQALTEFLANN